MTLTPPEPSPTTAPAAPTYPGYPGDGAAQPAYTGPVPGDSVPGDSVPMPPYRSLRAAGLTAITFAALVTAIEIARAALAWPVQSTLLDILDGGNPGIGVLNAYDALTIPTYICALGAFIATGIWLHRAHTQAERVRPWVNRPRRSGWAWGGWIVPVVNLWFPLQVVRGASLDPAHAGQRATVRSWWWGAWIGYLILTRITSRLLGGADVTPSSVRLLGAFETITALFAVAALALWISVVRSITRDHDAELGAR